MASIPTSGETHNGHIVPEENPFDESVSFNKFQDVWYLITSTICTSLFLSILMLCALSQKLWRYLFQNSPLHSQHKLSSHTDYKSPEELKLVPDLNYYYRLLGLQVDRYEIITQDNFVITIQRIVDPGEPVEISSKRKPLLFLHGLLQSSGSFCSGGKQSLAYFFFKRGYDVWLGNNRCGFEPRHMVYHSNDFKMWDWDIVDMAQYDLTAMINHVLKNTTSGASKLTLISHSQGTTQGFISLDNDRFGNNCKVNCFVALSPAVYGGVLLDTKTFIKVIAKMSLTHFFFGIKSFLPIMMSMRNLLVTHKIFGYLSYSMFNYLFDWNDALWDKDLKNRHFLFSPVYVSVKLMSWWLNDKSGFKISKSILKHDAKWLDENSPPIFLVIPKKDKLVDGQMLINHLNNYEETHKYDYIYLEDYSHLDVLWSKTAIDDVGEPIFRFINQLT